MVKKYTCFSITLIPTFAADAAHHDVFKVGVKVIILAERPLQRREKILIAVNGFTAPGAYQVMVVSIFGMMIDKVVAQSAFINGSCFYQEFQRAVDRGLIDSRHIVPDMPYDFLGGEMAFSFVDNIHDEHSLRGQL
jgi:hypothetical protein